MRNGRIRPGQRLPGQPEGWFWTLLPGLMAAVVPPVLRFWARTLRLKVTGVENLKAALDRGGAIFAIWHGNMAIPVYVMRNRGVIGLVSPVWLGELIAGVVQGLGFDLIRASSHYNTHRGTREILKALDNDRAIAIMLDGPSGPARQVNAGVIELAALSGKPIVTGFGVGKKSFHLPTWDRSEWPIPFCKARLHIDEPIYIPRKITRAQRDEYRELLRQRLFALEQEVRESLKD